MGNWLKENPIGSMLLNIALYLIILLLIIKLYINDRIDNRIINEYQKPIIEKLDTIIDHYDEQRKRNETN